MPVVPGSLETHVYLVRHGETDWNREQRLQGSFDVPLNNAGAAQARRLADHFLRIPVVGIVSSPLARAAATAAILADACACPHTTDPRLREIDHGTWSGRTLPDLGRCFPSLVKDERLLPEAFDVSRAEPLFAVYRRASEALADLLDAYDGQSVVVVGHGITLGAMWCAAAGLETAQLHDHQLPNAGGVVLTFSQRHLVDARVMTIAEVPA
jgi:broad specificity phosphatase PhoE